MLKFSRHINKKRKKQNKTKKKKQAMFAVTQELFYKKKNAPKIQVKYSKMPQEGSFLSQAADYKSATQLKTLPPQTFFKNLTQT